MVKKKFFLNRVGKKKLFWIFSYSKNVFHACFVLTVGNVNGTLLHYCLINSVVNSNFYDPGQCPIKNISTVVGIIKKRYQYLYLTVSNPSSICTQIVITVKQVYFPGLLFPEK